MKFSHLHVHTQFSLLDGAAEIGSLYKKAIQDNMPAIAITDHGNMFGAFEFVAEAYKHKHDDGTLKVKPIVGCEFYLVANRHKRSFTKDDKDQRFHQLLLAKNAEGYQNLIKLCSLGYTEGMYGKYPRIDKELVEKYHTGLIATTCCLGASVPRVILRKGEEEGEKEFKWWLDLFGEDYYIELQRHDIPDQNKVNEVLLKFAQKYNVPIIASNDSHYVDQQDANAHDILLCINTNEKQSTPTLKDFSDDDVNVKGKRFAFANDQFYFKTTAEMSELFKDIPEAIDNTNAIVDKIETLNLKRDILLPNYEIPANFTSQDDYLHHLTFTGAKERYKEITPDVEERLNFELHTIKTMGFAGYFLIVADFIKAGRDLGVFVGPGRGSAAGSAVAYCIGITNIDPIKYDLLFERFLNPDRKSMPDIDTDFDDLGRQKVIDYVINKYGRNQVAQIVTYGTMAAKSSIKDVARVLDLPLPESNALAGLVPSKPGISLERVLHAPMDGDKSLKDKEGLDSDELANVTKIREIYNGTDLKAKVLKEAEKLEGSVRGTGVHAAGLIIAPKDLMEIVPVAVAKDSDLVVTQYEGKVIEDAGVIKMDFLGLKNLTILKNALLFIKANHGVEIVLDEIPLDDQTTYGLFQRGETNGIFQFESAGMQKYLKDLKPDQFSDLIAMNALFRPGPLAYIPTFIKRKHGQEPITYDLPEMEEYLKDTYGVTVYQEQVMLLSQKLAGFTKGDADVLRKAMGKKDKKTLDKMKGKFMEGAAAKGHPSDKLEKIWTDWEAFAQYAFNKSHSTCYAYVAFHTAYLKTHYPAEYMAAVLGNSSGNIEDVAFFMEECKSMGLNVLGPDVNESLMNFSVNKDGIIRFGLSAIKGVGEGAVESILEERSKGGPFTSIFDLTKRVNLRAVNKKTLEALAYAGGFDCFKEVHRAQYFHLGQDGINLIERAIRYGNSVQTNASSGSMSLFGESSGVVIPEPPIPVCETWGLMYQLKLEKEMIGMYLSGHPLDPYKIEIEKLVTHSLSDLKELAPLKNKDIKIVGMVTAAEHRVSKMGKNYGSLTIEDLSGTFQFALFNNDYLDNRKYMEVGYFLFIRGKVQNRWQKEDDFEVKIQGIEMLSELREKYFNKLTVKVELEKMNRELLDYFVSLGSNKPGNCNVYFDLIDHLENQGLRVMSTKLRVNPNNEVIKELELMGLEPRLN
ncbi:MAG: DNA polymerase III subunit alpha [Bacteroidetes bacterium]|nr:DNA polymerase III subunit alpha [Bacteroidota bacterium]